MAHVRSASSAASVPDATGTPHPDRRGPTSSTPASCWPTRRALGRFDEHEVVLPVVVVTELEAKRHHPELGYFARAALRRLDELRVEHGRLDRPVPIGDAGGTLRVELNHTDPASLPSGFRLGDNDTRILAVARNLADEGARRHAGLQGPAAADQGLGGRARRRGVPRRARRPSPAGPAWSSSRSPRADLDELYDDGTRRPRGGRASCPATPGWCCSPSAAARWAGSTPDKQVQLVRGDREAFGLHGRSAEQRVALDLLLDPEVGIVSLGGRAGTGKSALALCAGLEAVHGAAPAQEGRGLPPAATPSAARSSATCRARRARRCRPGRRRSSTPSAR